MLKISIHGLGYVGLVTGLCLAKNEDNLVTGFDVDKNKIETLNQGKLYLYEKGLQDLLDNSLHKNFLPTSCFSDTIDSLIDIIAVGTPSKQDGTANLEYVKKVASMIGRNMQDYKVIVTKSTVPPGTHLAIENIIKSELEKRQLGVNFDIASVPEFLKEGTAVEDFSKPDRIVIGTKSERARQVLDQLFRPYVLNGHPIIHMNPFEAETVKYASNAMLALKVAYTEELSQLAEALAKKYGTKVDVLNVLKGMCSDSRIGDKFFKPGPGYGGSCFPKDTRALANVAMDVNLNTSIISSINRVNEAHKNYLANKIFEHYKHEIDNKTLALWGLAFKAETDDVRDSASINIVRLLTANGAKVKCFDPKAMHEFKKLFSDNTKVVYCNNKYEALKQANGLIIMTEWDQFKTPDVDKLNDYMVTKVVFDYRNLYAGSTIEKLLKKNGFVYYGVGR